MKDDPFAMLIDVVMSILAVVLGISLLEMNVQWIAGCVALFIVMHPIAERCGVFDP